jgi:hypothetical protein
MASYIEYQLENGTTVLLEVDERGGIVKASNRPGEPIPSRVNFSQAFSNINSSIFELVEHLERFRADEAEVRFGLKSVGEAGIFAIGKLGSDINYEITLRWKKRDVK